MNCSVRGGQSQSYLPPFSVTFGGASSDRTVRLSPFKAFSSGWLDLGSASLAAALAILGGVFVGSLFASHNAQRAYLHDVDPYAQVVVK